MRSGSAVGFPSLRSQSAITRIEQGNHQELMALGGQYAELGTLQASKDEA